MKYLFNNLEVHSFLANVIEHKDRPILLRSKPRDLGRPLSVVRTLKKPRDAVRPEGRVETVREFGSCGWKRARNGDAPFADVLLCPSDRRVKAIFIDSNREDGVERVREFTRCG
jgi:hypothetical protein